MTKRLFLTVVAAVTVGLGFAGTAQAAPGPDTRAVWRLYNYYWVNSDCVQAGSWLVATGQVRAWNCPDTDHDGYWELMVLD